MTKSILYRQQVLFINTILIFESFQCEKLLIQYVKNRIVCKYKAVIDVHIINSW